MAARELTVEEVKALSIGIRVNIEGEDQSGEHRVIECTVAGVSGHDEKFLTYRVKGELRRCAIKEYPGKRYCFPAAEGRRQ